jgi:hypothetical protein
LAEYDSEIDQTEADHQAAGLAGMASAMPMFLKQKHTVFCLKNGLPIR